MPDFFRSRLDAMLDPRHPLVVLASRVDWAQIEARIAPLLARDGVRPLAEGVGRLRCQRPARELVPE